MPGNLLFSVQSLLATPRLDGIKFHLTCSFPFAGLAALSSHRRIPSPHLVLWMLYDVIWSPGLEPSVRSCFFVGCVAESCSLPGIPVCLQDMCSELVLAGWRW